MDETWKVGELAERAGVSIRTLHYYDEVGLLSPSKRTGGEHRLYSAADLEQLLRVRALRELGFSVEKIKSMIGRPEVDLSATIRARLDHLQEQIELQQQVRDRLAAISRCLDAGERVTSEELFKTIRGLQVLENLDKYYDEDQLAQLAERRAQLGEERIREAEGEWAELIRSVREQMDAGADPTSEPVLTLARKWQSLIEEFTARDPGITASLKRMWSNEPNLGQMTGIDSAMFEYVGQALAAIRGEQQA